MLHVQRFAEKCDCFLPLPDQATGTKTGADKTRAELKHPNFSRSVLVHDICNLTSCSHAETFQSMGQEDLWSPISCNKKPLRMPKPHSHPSNFRQPAADLSSEAGKNSSAIKRHFKSYLKIFSLPIKHLIPL